MSDTAEVGSGEMIWTAMHRGVDGQWRPVGTEGGEEHAENEMRDWVRSGIDRASMALARRYASPWVLLSRQPVAAVSGSRGTGEDRTDG